MKTILFGLFLFMTSAINAAQFEYYADSKPRIKEEVILFHTTGNCSDSEFTRLRRAFDAWNQVEVRLVYSPEHTAMEFDETFTLDCQPSQASTLARSQKLSRPVPEGISHRILNVVGGQAHIYWSRDDGEILDGDITLYADGITESNFNKVLRHEVGHVHGLVHSKNADALMARAPIVNDLTIEDMGRISVLYGDCDVIAHNGIFFIPEARFFYDEVSYRGFVNVPAGEVYNIELSECGL